MELYEKNDMLIFYACDPCHEVSSDLTCHDISVRAESERCDFNQMVSQWDFIDKLPLLYGWYEWYKW